MEAPSAQQVAQLGSNTSRSTPHVTISNKVDKAVDLTSTVAAIVKEVAEVLQHAPYVKTLSGVILQFIKIKDELKLNKERCHEIIDKVLHLSHWIYEKLTAITKSGERVKENLAEIESSLNLCASTLTTVLDELKKHQSRSKFTKFVSRGLEDLNKLDRSVDNLEKRLIRDIVFDIKLQQGTTTNGDVANPASSGHDHVLPPKPHLIVERDSQLNASLEILLADDTSRIAITGGGGFGKTTLARTILYHPSIIERYKRRYFLTCEGMTNDDTLLLGFGSMLRITAPPPDILASARRILQTSSTLLCLDNFETTWEPPSTRKKVEELLASIAQIPQLSLIITIRGTQRPSEVAWSHPLLQSLPTVSLDGAKAILQVIAPEHTVDEYPNLLLEAIDGIPLAITLVSTLLRDGESSHSLWRRWSRNQTAVVQTGGADRQSNLNASISMSVKSDRMVNNPDAIVLLGALSVLPRGFPSDGTILEKLEAYLGIQDIHSALQILRTVALVSIEETNTSPRIRMLSPIRLFCNEFLSAEITLVFNRVIDYYIKIALDAEDRKDNPQIYAQIVPEIQNMHSVFQTGFKSGYSQEITQLIDATVILTEWSDYIGYSTHDTIEIALEQSTDLPILHAKCLHARGTLYYTEGNHVKARACFTEAADLFEQGNNPVRQARALEWLGDVLCSMQQLDAAEHAFQASLDLYTQAGHKVGQAHVRNSLGELYIAKDQYSEAEENLTAALEAHKETQSLLGQSNTANGLSVLHIILGNLAKAKEFATEALDTAKQANYALGEGNAHQWLGHVYLSTDRVEEAKESLEKALAIDKQQNHITNQLNTVRYLGEVYIQSDQLSAAEALLTVSAKLDLDVIHTPIILTTLGWLYICGDQLDKAEQHLARALKLFQKFGNISGQVKVLAHLGDVYLRSNRLDDARRVLRSIPDLGRWRDVELHRLQVLGDLYIAKGQLNDADTALNSAMAGSQNWEESYSYKQGNILRSMGALHVKRGRIDRAIRAFKRAREFHRKAQWVSEQATDLKRLGEAYEMLGSLEDAEVVFKEADVLMESVREARVLSEP